MVEVCNPDISINKQCKLLGIAKSSYYYKPAVESALNLQLMKLLDEQYMKTPFYGIRKMTAFLNRQGYQINHKRVRRLMKLMGIEAIYPKKHLSSANNEHKKYPYLLKDLIIDRSNQVWAMDITYIRLLKGFIYLTVVMDWYSRFIISWKLSNTLDVYFCIEALEEALTKSSPIIFNTDQGSQFTSSKFIDILEKSDIKISMDGRGRVFDNIFIERLWRTVKYEEVYIHNYEIVKDAYQSLNKYFTFYNTERIHERLNYATPEEIYLSYMKNDTNKKESIYL
jgi:putative transposase